MHLHKITISFITALAAVCCLPLGGLASQVAAKPIVVTTLTDTADPPFNADGLCGTGTVNDLPGADGLVSLREAIIAANNTAGEKKITFAPNLSGGIIVVNFDDLDADAFPDPLPALCGGQTRIKGDLDGDDVPDITLEGAAIPVAAPPLAGAGLLIISSHNSITGLRVQHFPIGIRVRAGDFTTAGIVEHTQVKNTIVAASRIDGIDVRTGNVPGSLVAHTTLTQNTVSTNARFGILVVASLSGVGSDSQIDHTIITDNTVTNSGQIGIFLLSVGDRNVLSDTTIARNTVSNNTFLGINVSGGVGGADGNTVDIHIKDNTVTDNGLFGIRVNAGQDNSSDNHIEALVRGNIVERNRQFCGILAIGAVGASTPVATGTSVNNVLDVRIEQNTVRSQTGTGICMIGAGGGPGGQAGAIGDNNQVTAVVKQNVVEDNTAEGILLAAGGDGRASGNTLEVRVAHNTVCHNTGPDIAGEGGDSGHPPLLPNLGTGNLLQGRIFQNTATTVVVRDGAQNGTPENIADVRQFKNEPCP